jgi:hypothetical protein
MKCDGCDKLFTPGISGISKEWVYGEDTVLKRVSSGRFEKVYTNRVPVTAGLCLDCLHDANRRSRNDKLVGIFAGVVLTILALLFEILGMKLGLDWLTSVAPILIIAGLVTGSSSLLTVWPTLRKPNLQDDARVDAILKPIATRKHLEMTENRRLGYRLITRKELGRRPPVTETAVSPLPKVKD